MRDKIKIGAIGKIIHTNKIIKRVGLDTDVMIALIDDIKEFSLFRSRIFNNKNILYINYKVFSELVGHFIYSRKFHHSSPTTYFRKD